MELRVLIQRIKAYLKNQICSVELKNIRKDRSDIGFCKVKANQQHVIDRRLDAVPDMYGWTKKMQTSLRMD